MGKSQGLSWPHPLRWVQGAALPCGSASGRRRPQPRRAGKPAGTPTDHPPAVQQPALWGQGRHCHWCPGPVDPPGAWPAVGAASVRHHGHAHCLLLPPMSFSRSLISLTGLFRALLLLFQPVPPCQGTARAITPTPLQPTFSPPGPAPQDDAGHPPAAGALRRCWSMWWRCGSWAGRCCRQPAMLCSFCGGPTSWQADWFPPAEGQAKNWSVSTDAGAAASPGGKEAGKWAQRRSGPTAPQSPISHPGIATAAAPGCGMRRAAPYGSSRGPPVSDGQREGGPSSCVPTSAQAPVATAHPARTRRTGTGKGQHGSGGAHPNMPCQPPSAGRSPCPTGAGNGRCAGLSSPIPAVLPRCSRTHLGGDEVLGRVSPPQVHGQHHALTLLAACFLAHLEQAEVASLRGLQQQSGVLSAIRASEPSSSPTASPLPTLPGSPGHPGTAGQCGQHSSAPAGGQ